MAPITWKNVAAFNAGDLIRASNEATDAFTRSVQGLAKTVDPTQRQKAEGEREGKRELAESISNIRGLQGLGDIRGAEEQFDADLAGPSFMSDEQLAKVEGVYDKRLGKAREQVTESALTRGNLAAGAEEDVMAGKRAMVEELRAQNMSEPEIEKRVAQFDASGLQEETYAAALKKRTDEAIREFGPHMETNLDINEKLEELGQLEGKERINLVRAKSQFESMVKGTTADRKFNQRQNELKIINGQATIEEIAAKDKNFDTAAATVNLRKFQEVQDKLPPEQRRKYQTWQQTAKIKSDAVAQQHDLGIASKQAAYDSLEQHHINPVYRKTVKGGKTGIAYIKQQTEDGGLAWLNPDLGPLQKLRKANVGKNGVTAEDFDAIIMQAFANSDNKDWGNDTTITKEFLDNVKELALNHAAVKDTLAELNDLKAGKISAMQKEGLDRIQDGDAIYQALQDGDTARATKLLDKVSTLPEAPTSGEISNDDRIMNETGFPQVGDASGETETEARHRNIGRLRRAALDTNRFPGQDLPRTR